VLTENGKPIDMGRNQRLATPALHRYLALRDRGCAFPGCDRPPAWCQAHHLKEWANGGETDHRNLLLLCRHHHTVVHQQDWDIFVDDAEIPWFRPPAGIDPFRRPIPANGRTPAPATI
jgi:hypothetical protein